MEDIGLYYYNTCENSIEEYDRVVKSYIKYYHLRARRCKRGFYFWSVLKLILLAIMPVLQAAGVLVSITYLVAAISSGILLIESILELWRFREKWVLYRSTCNQLMSIQRFFMESRANDVDKKRLEYVEAVEAIIGDEARSWREISKDVKKGNTSISSSL